MSRRTEGSAPRRGREDTAMERARAQVVRMERRDFLRLGLAAGGGLALGVALPGCVPVDAEAFDDTGIRTAGAAPFRLNAFVRVDTDGSVTVWCGKVDMGQGVRTALPMIVADELDVPWERVRPVQADAHPERFGRQMTVGSSSVRRGAWTELRRAGAAARAMLVAAAALRLDVPARELETGDGRVTHPGSGRSLGYGELAEAAAALDVPQEPTLKDPADFRYIGKGVPLAGLEEKVTGSARFGMDVRVEGMLYATVAKPRVLGGSLESMDEAAARRVEGVRDVARVSSGVAVLAENTWAAFEGAKALDCRWTGDFDLSSDDISAHHAGLLDGAAVEARRDGDAPGRLDGASGVVEAAYEVPYLAHATMEPMNCTADVRADRAELWVPTQNPQGAQSVAAELAGLPVEAVAVHPTWLGCGWGRRGSTDYVNDAVEASMAAGAPVQLVWTREEDTRNDFYRPASTIRFRGRTEAGRIDALHARVAGPPLGVTGPRGRGGSGVDRNAVDGIVTHTYDIPHFLTEYCRSEVQVPTGYWRSVGPSGNCFMIEGFVDELAEAAGADPLDFRLAMLDGHPRMKHVLETAAGMADWAAGPSGGRGRGIGIVEDKGGIVAQIAEVSVDEGDVRVHRVWVAADCGRIIHPGIAHQQMVGSVVAGLTAALHGEITLDGGRVVQSNFHDYPMLRMREMPRVDVHLVDSDEEPGGVGEPAVPPIAPAVANAVYRVTGRRVRKLPIRV